MNTIKVKHIKISLGELILGEYEGKLCLFDWKYRKMRSQIDNRIQSGLNAVYAEEDCELFHQLESQLEEYLLNKREVFDIPLLTVGTPFQKSVWENLQTISYGKTETYLGLSHLMNNPKAIRAVAGANGANAISILIPCHRIISSDGSLGGYAGGLPTKQKLINLENQLYLDL
ncbi:MAG: methylated-DNA--[protein]-cysteine S-methyltransferase [Spirochaetaceae bacterium]|jgi:methylated-DNA-[protein]-cysteine S-methyltransferase|nr:methylated-DNA--[protein]-cysteine S-methyltransferase [Spirochaetaceae bacterium]